MNLYSVEIQRSSCGVKGSPLSASLEDEASPMVSRRFDKNIKEEDAMEMPRRFVQGGKFF